MKQYISTFTLTLSLLFNSMTTMATGPLNNLSSASDHSVQASGQTTVAGVKVISGAVAIPLIIVGKIGEASGQAGDDLWDTATIGEPLEITDDIITSTVSPDQAMLQAGE